MAGSTPFLRGVPLGLVTLALAACLTGACDGSTTPDCGETGTCDGTTTSDCGEPSQVDCYDGCDMVSQECVDGVYQCPPQKASCGGDGGETPSPPIAAKWSQGHGDADVQYGSAVAAGPAGEVIFTAGFGAAIDLGGGPLINAVENGMGGVDIALAKLTADGKHVWSKSFGSP